MSYSLTTPKNQYVRVTFSDDNQLQMIEGGSFRENGVLWSYHPSYTNAQLKDALICVYREDPKLYEKVYSIQPTIFHPCTMKRMIYEKDLAKLDVELDAAIKKLSEVANKRGELIKNNITIILYFNSQ